MARPHYLIPLSVSEYGQVGSVSNSLVDGQPNP